MPTQQKTPIHKGQRIRKPIISPERRLAALVLWGIALAALISIPFGKVPMISFIPSLLKGLFGFGYYFVPVTLFAAGYALLANPKGPGLLQAFLCGLMPIPIGSIHHAIFCTAAAASSESSLWETGAALQSGGVLSGGAAQGLVSILGVPATAVLAGILLAALIGIALLPSILKHKAIEKKASEAYYSRSTPRSTASYRPETERNTFHHAQGKRVRSSAHSKIAAYNIPMDGDVSEPVESAAVSGDAADAAVNGFYRPKSETIRSPVDNILDTLENDPVQEISELDMSEPEPEPDQVPFTEVPPFKPHTFNLDRGNANSTGFSIIGYGGIICCDHGPFHHRYWQGGWNRDTEPLRRVDHRQCHRDFRLFHLFCEGRDCETECQRQGTNQQNDSFFHGFLLTAPTNKLHGV